MTNNHSKAIKYVIDYLSEEEREDTIIKSAINNLKKLSKSIYKQCETREDIAKVLDEIDNLNSDIVIHFLSHGHRLGLAKKTDTYLLEIIHWELLLISLEKVTKKCKTLSINLMAVCSSHNITFFQLKPYNLIWTTSGITNSIEKSILIYSETNDFNTVVQKFEEPHLFHQLKGLN